MICRVLVIDDERYCLEQIKHWLIRFGCEVFTAINAEDGFVIALKVLPDVILCDMHMKRHNGYEFADWCKRNEQLKYTPLIAITGLHSMFADRLRATEVGYEDVIYKESEYSATLPERVIAICSNQNSRH